ncbi:MOSC domain-containing protein [Planomicrobium sp. CPCC 101110]|uniref:MOSC domain-containing protein n=1 Tax=Planomicrobium sp. CPCC 101110 TaxID=2599619 RepID=UPI0011B8448C|nr:MOSC domain-containing protein [Planomicrobium sp. CPCC 101110]TWT26440.1 MOSC domain-containing protein [Planomicrobium sp. CPCC 101110]
MNLQKVAAIEIRNLAVGLPELMKYGEGKEMKTAIRKKPVERVFLSKEKFQGDDVADLKHHGGPDRAVCIYPYEHYALWEKEFGKPLPASAFGENVTAANMLEETVFIGDIYRLGEAVIQVNQGRVPCSTIDRNLDMTPLLKAMVKTGFTGYMCRVLEEGYVSADSSLELLEQHPQKVSVLYTNQVFFHEPKNIEGIKRILAVPELADEWRDKFEMRLSNLLKKQAE